MQTGQNRIECRKEHLEKLKLSTDQLYVQRASHPRRSRATTAQKREQTVPNKHKTKATHSVWRKQGHLKAELLFPATCGWAHGSNIQRRVLFSCMQQKVLNPHGSISPSCRQKLTPDDSLFLSAVFIAVICTAARASHERMQRFLLTGMCSLTAAILHESTSKHEEAFFRFVEDLPFSACAFWKLILAELFGDKGGTAREK